MTIIIEVIIGATSFVVGALATGLYNYIREEREIRRRTQHLYDSYIFGDSD